MSRRALTILGLFFLLLGALGVQVYRSQLQLAEHREQNQLLSIARLKVEQIVAWRKERLGDAGVLNANWRLLTGFSDWLKAAAAPRVQDDLTKYIEALQQHYGYRDYLLIDATGRVRLQSGAPTAIALETEAQAALAEVRRSREPRLTDLHTDTAFPYPHLGLIVPFFEGEALAGALILVIDARQTLYPLLQGWPVSSVSAESLLVRREGDDALFLNEVRYRPGSALRLRVPLTQIEIPPMQAIQGTAKVVEGRDYRGTPVLAAVVPVPNSTWWVVAKIDRQELYAGVWWEAALASGVLLALLALAGAVLGLVWQRRQRQQTQWLLKAQAAERESLNRFRNLFDQSQDGILLLSSDHRVLDANPAALALLGYGREALSGLSLPDLLVPDEHARLASAVTRMMAGEPHQGEWRHCRADGSIFVAQVTSQRLDEGHYYATLHDVTQQRELEAAQAETTRRLQLILTAATDGLWDWNLLTGEDFHSPRYREMLGYDRDEFTDYFVSFEAVVHPDDLPHLNAALQAHLERREPFQVELRLRTKQGDYRWFASRGQAEWDADGRPLRMAGFITDITGRKRAERELRLYRALIDANKDAVCIIRPDASLHYVNEAACRVLEYTREELLGGMTVADIDPLYGPPIWQRHWQELKAAGSLAIETQHRGRSGRVFPVEAHLTFIEHEGQEFNCAIIRDITERKAAADALRRSEARLDYALTQSHTGAWTMNLNDYTVLQTLEHDRLFGYEVLQTDWNYDRFRAHVLAEDWDALDAHLKATVRQGGTLVLECRIRRVDGAIRWVRIVGDYQPPQAGEAPRYAGIIQDITDAKALEASLRAELLLREQLQQTSENIPGVIYTLRLSPDGRMAMPYAGAKLLDLYGYPPEAVTEDVGPLLALVHPDDAERIRASIEASAENLNLFRQTWRINHPARGIVWIEGISSPSRGDDGSIIWHGFLSDVTERKALDAALQEAGERYANLLRATKDGFWLVEAGSGRLLDVNDAAVSLSGYTREEMLTLRVTDLDIDFQGEKYIAQIQRIRAAGWGLFESRIRQKDGRIIPVEVSVIPEVGDHKILAFIRDISERRRADQALRDSEFRWQFAIEGAGDGLWDWDVASGICFYSQRWKSMIGYAEDEIGTSLDEWTQRVHPEDWNHVQATWQAHLDGTMPQHVVEYRLRHKDGSWVWILGRGLVSERDAAGLPLRVIGTHTDITERKANERMLRLTQFAMESAVDEVYYIRQDGRFQYVNDAACRALEYRREELLAMTVPEVDSLFTEEIWREHWQKMKVAGALTLETQHRSRSGRVYPVEIHVNFIEHEGEEYSCSLCRDITERKRMEATLRENERRFRMLADTSPLAIYVSSGLEQRCEYINPRFVELFGYTQEEVPTVNDWFSLAYPDPGYRTMIAESWQSRVADAIENSSGIEPMDLVVTCKDGARKHIQWGFIAVGGQQWAFGLDMTERKAAEQAVLELNAGLEQKIAERTAELAERTAQLAHLSERLELAMQVTSDGLWDCDLLTEKVYCNANYFAMLGYGPTELGDNVADVLTNLLPPEEREAIIASIRQRFATEGGHESEFRMRAKDGSYRWIFARGRVIDRDDDRRPRRAIGTHIDITARKEAEAALRALSNYSRRLIETSLDPLVTISPEGRILDVNSATERVTGCPREQLIGSDFSSYFTEPDQARAGYEQVFAEGFVTDYPLAIRHADGHVTDVLYNASVYRNDAGEVAGVFAAARDVTERRRQEQALRESEARFRHLADAAPVLIWMSGQDKLCYYFNHTWLDFTGRTLEQEFGNGWFEGVHADDADACMRTYLESFEARRPFSMEYRLRRHDGEYRWLRDDGAPRFDGQGRFLGYIGSCIDITEGRRAEEVLQDLNVTLERKVAERTTQLAEAKAAAEAAARSKSEFLANMSHEIRTPMNAILGLTQILEREPLTPDQRDMLQKIGDSGAGLLHIINDILDFSKIEAGQLKVEHYPFDLPPLLSLLESLMTGSAVGRGIELRIEPPVGLPGPVIGDPLRIKQILLNLVSNAIKFTEQGTVTVRVLPLALTETVARLRFEVSDTGIGIAPEALAKLFQPFTQADASMTRRFGGTGLGLSICKRLVELMGGTIGATSELGGGSTFWFELPFERAAAAAVTAGTPAEESAAPAPAGPRLQGLKVLAVDDNRINLFMLERALKLEGASVQLAADGQQALQILEADPRGFEVVLMDVQMPVMDGLTATRLIREHAELHKLPVIALTAGVMAEERERAAAAGVTGFLAKPLDLAAMVAMLRPYAPAMDAEPPPAQS